KAIRTTDPNAFYAYQKKENELGYDEPNFTNEPSVNQEKRKKIIEIIDKKFKKARNNAKHFFKQEELNILDALKKCKAEYITFKEKT
ncbi:13821_t:CDS:2, partial [Entrophospora sp. SA101]